MNRGKRTLVAVNSASDWLCATDWGGLEFRNRKRNRNGPSNLQAMQRSANRTSKIATGEAPPSF